VSQILITGGLGSAGEPLVTELEDRGHDVWVPDLPWWERDRYYCFDVSEYRQLQRVFPDRAFDYVYHLAAEFGRRNGEEYYETMWESNAVGTKNVLRLQEEHGFRLISTSSGEVYEDYDGVMEESVPREEGTPRTIDWMRDYYNV
jgi:dTDP-glucose 4,6-dehydratase